MAGLSSIRPEIQEFISRENRSHADPWLQQVDWVESERTLKLFVQRPPTALAQVKKPGADPATWDRDGLLGTLSRPSLLNIYFPASLDEKPFCFCEDDDLVPATEAANDRLRPLSCNSVLAVVTTALQCAKRELPPLTSSPAGVGAARAQLAAEAILCAVKEDPLGADLGLALLSMAVSSYRRETVSTPFPKQLQSSDLKREFSAFVSCLEDIPSMRKISSWTDPGRLLLLPPIAVLALHFVLVDLPARLRTPVTSSDRSHIHGLPSGISSGKAERGSTATALPAASSSSAKTGGANVGSSGVGSSGKGGGRGVGGVGGAQLGDVPSYVFRVLLPSDPAFDAEAARGGSKVAFHGSSPENFHSILNTGLRVMSGSRLMKNGAAFGEGIYLSGSRNAAATFACRGDGSGTTVWPRSVFRDSSGPTARAGVGVGASTKGEAPPHEKFRYRLVAQCRVLKGEGVKEIEGWGDEASYFVVSDQSRVRVEALLLFHESQPGDKLAADGGGSFAAAPDDGTADRALVSGSSVSGKGKGTEGEKEVAEKGGEDDIDHQGGS
eukprot:g10128.t1